MQNDRPVSYVDAYVASKLQPGHRWRAIGTEAGLTSEELSAIRRNFPEPLFVFAAILAWKKKNEHLTVGTLIAALTKLRYSQISLLNDDFERCFSVIPAKGWRALGRRLGASDEELEKIGAAFDRECNKRVMAVLVDWQLNRTEACTLPNLFTAVRNLGGSDAMWDAKGSPTLTLFELWEAYQQVQQLDAREIGDRFGIDIGDLERKLEQLEVERELHCLAVFDEWCLQKPKECKLGVLFEIMCDLERTEEAVKIFERLRDFRWVKNIDTKVIPKEDLRRVLDSVPVAQWHRFGRELGLSTLELFEIRKAAGPDVIVEIIRVWMESPSSGSRFLAFKRAVEKSGGVLFERDENVIYEEMIVELTDNGEVNDDYITLDALRLTESGVKYINKKIRETAGSCETVCSASDGSSQEPIYSEISLGAEQEIFDEPILAEDRYEVIRSRYFRRDEEDYFINQLQIGYIITVKKVTNSALKKAKKTKAIVVELSHRVIVACLDAKTKTHMLIPLQDFWPSDSLVRIDNSEDQQMPTWPTREIIKRATDYESFGVNTRSCDEFVKWCRYDGFYLPVHWNKVMTAAAKRLTVHQMPDHPPPPVPRQLSEGEIANVTMNVLREMQAAEQRRKPRRGSNKKRLSMDEIEEMDLESNFEDAPLSSRSISEDVANETDGVFEANVTGVSTAQASTQCEITTNHWVQQEPDATDSSLIIDKKPATVDLKEWDPVNKIAAEPEDKVDQLERYDTSVTREDGSHYSAIDTSSCERERKAEGFFQEKVYEANLRRDSQVLIADQDEDSSGHQSKRERDPWDNYETRSAYYTPAEKQILFDALRNADILDIRSKGFIGSLLHVTTKAIVVEEGCDPRIAFVGEDGEHTTCRLESLWDGQQIRVDNSMDRWNPVLPLDEVVRRARCPSGAPRTNRQFATWCRYNVIPPTLETTMKMVTMLSANATFFVSGPFSATIVLATGVVLTKLANSHFLRKYML